MMLLGSPDGIREGGPSKKARIMPERGASKIGVDREGDFSTAKKVSRSATDAAKKLTQFFQPRNGYFQSWGGLKVSLIVRGEIQRCRFCGAPALSFVPLALEPPKGCCPTTAPVGLSLI